MRELPREMGIKFLLENTEIGCWSINSILERLPHPVDTEISLSEKIDLEAPFHAMCNGGCISFVELNEQPSCNIEGVQKIVEYAIKSNCNYFGVNFPLDKCKICGHFGKIDDTCSSCGSTDILRLRRVSGYLSEKATFTIGKKKELELRKAFSWH